MDYFIKHGNALSMVRTHKMIQLVRDGIPNNLRGKKSEVVIILKKKRKIMDDIIWSLCIYDYKKENILSISSRKN